MYLLYICILRASVVSVFMFLLGKKKGKRKVHGEPQSQTAALSRHQEEEETDKTNLSVYIYSFHCFWIHYGYWFIRKPNPALKDPSG